MAITGEQYRLLVRSYREEPGGVSKAAREAGLSRPTARKAWTSGIGVWVAKGQEEAAPPIKETVEEEQKAARASLLERQAERAVVDAEKARQDVIQARKQEAELVRGERANVMALIGTTGVILQGAIASAHEIQKALRTGKDPVTGKPIGLKDHVVILERIARLVRQAGESAVDVVRLERLLLGEPTEILGIRDLDSISEEDAIRELAEAGEVARRMAARRKRDGFTVIDGGKEESA